MPSPRASWGALVERTRALKNALSPTVSKE